MRLDPYKYDNTELWEAPGWEDNRHRLLNDWARASLRKQTCQNFTFVTLWWEECPGGGIDNEIQIAINETGTQDDEPLDYRALTNNKKGKKTLNFSGQIRDKIRDRFKAPLLVTNLDCDDALHYKFVEVLQGQDFPDTPYHYSSTKRYCYNLKTKSKGVKVARSPSPFVSTWEPEIECYPLRYNHSYLHRWIPGSNIEGLEGLQTVNDTNMFSRSVGDKAEFNLSDYV